MRRKTLHGRARSRRIFLFFTVLFWSLFTITCITILKGGLLNSETSIGQEMGKQYLSAAFPAISRSTGAGIRASFEESPFEGSLIITKRSAAGEEKQDKSAQGISEPGNGSILDSVSYDAPVILIYHTHATESYLPVDSGNYHSIEEKGTVREAGSVLKAALEAKGIPAVHNKSIYDSPSYSKSYSRSLEATQKTLSSNPTIRIIIDLHRDAASYSGNNKHSFITEGKEAAQFCLVVGRGNENANALTDFANRINQKANSLYPGFSKGIILKEYRYNQFIDDNCILLEMGNNLNTIEEVRVSAALFARVIEEILKEM